MLKQTKNCSMLIICKSTCLMLGELVHHDLVFMFLIIFLQVDLTHLLASRDQELRALSAEMNQVHSELRVARGLIAEKDSEIQLIRGKNNQYVEENERLRAILGEWSTRAAKLERALEAERVSNMELQKNRAKLRRQSTREKIPDIPQSDSSSIGVL
ncbi:unnamed protein product [Triticum turgidum subsp. durum]|uniref:Uncharacterized protein n=1 Tax=Triticum turgidum subsp. durum TaxID=4567 RepID=A0A9R1BKR5_TRITD|nr:unnamed protein product [Triticum turgidum subsp. durum]